MRSMNAIGFGMCSSASNEKATSKRCGGFHLWRSSHTNSTPAGQLPTFAVPAGRGAGKTGFVSTNIRRKAKARPGTKASDTADSAVDWQVTFAK